MKRKLNVILLIELVISVSLTGLLIAILPPIFDKFIVKKIDTQFINSENWIEYVDLDYDNESEKIILRGGGITNETNKPSNAVLYTSDDELIDQLNFKGKWFSTLQTGDYNNDGIDEVFIFTTKNDSVFLQGISFFKKSLFLKDKFIVTGNPKFDPPANIYPGKFYDLNDDGFKEIIFGIMTSFKLSPRSLFAYDIENDTIYKTEDYGCWRNQLVFFDLNNDSIDEIFSGSTSPGNTRKTDTINYPDTSAWLIVFNSRLKLQFKPLEFEGFTSAIDVLPFSSGEKRFIAVSYKSSRKKSQPYLTLYSTDGKLIKKKYIDSKDNTNFQFIMGDREEFKSLYFMENEGLIKELDTNLSTVRSTKLKGISTKPFFYLDLDNDSADELIFLNRTKNQITITRNNLDAPVTIHLPEEKGHVFCSVKYNGDSDPQFVVQKGATVSYYSYKENWLFQLKYLVYFLILACAFLFIRLVQLLRNYQLIRENKKLDGMVQEQTKVLKIKNKLLSEANEEIQSQNQEIQSQSDEIMGQNEELHWYKEHLEKLIEEKTNELAIALKKAEESDRLKTSFLQNISHEVRTPMNSIIGFMSLLERKDSKLEREFKIITRSFNQLLNTIDDIILLSKLHLGEYQIRKKPVIIENLLNVLDKYGKQQVIESEKSITFKCDYGKDKKEKVSLDFKSIQMVFEELIDNAIKYTELGEVSIGCRKQISGAIEIYVKDSGVGIAESKIKHIFDAFRKLEIENKLFRGTGAGLAIVKSIITLHNAKIDVYSNQKTGTTFSVVFNLV